MKNQDDQILKLQNVSKSFGPIKALENVSFDVKRGEFVFLTGRSGAGKTTLLRLILREYQPDSGKIIFDGVDLVGLKDQDIPHIRQHIGVVFQDYKLINERTVRENVEVALAVLGIAEKEWKNRVDQILSLVGLSDRSELFPSQLSGGELQRTSLARALVVNPRLLLADEPTGNLDWETSKGILDLFMKINKEGKTIIMATHNEVIVKEAKKRVIKIDRGKIVGGQGKVEEKEVKAQEESPKEKQHEAKKSKMRIKVEEI